MGIMTYSAEICGYMILDACAIQIYFSDSKSYIQPTILSSLNLNCQRYSNNMNLKKNLADNFVCLEVLMYDGKSNVSFTCK